MFTMDPIPSVQYTKMDAIPSLQYTETVDLNYNHMIQLDLGLDGGKGKELAGGEKELLDVYGVDYINYYEYSTENMSVSPGSEQSYNPGSEQSYNPGSEQSYNLGSELSYTPYPPATPSSPYPPATPSSPYPSTTPYSDTHYIQEAQYTPKITTKKKGGRKKNLRPPSPQVMRLRREQANARERKRMNGLNDAFERLREVRHILGFQRDNFLSWG